MRSAVVQIIFLAAIAIKVIPTDTPCCFARSRCITAKRHTAWFYTAITFFIMRSAVVHIVILAAPVIGMLPGTARYAASSTTNLGRRACIPMCTTVGEVIVFTGIPINMLSCTARNTALVHFTYL
jgi:hypothetical protein